MQSTVENTDLALVLERLVRVVRRLATAGGLSFPAAATLVRLTREGPQRLTELAASEGVSQPGMTQLVRRLEGDGLLRRTAYPADKRVVLVDITDAGRELVARRRTERAEALHSLLERLDVAEREAVRQAVPALERLVHLADADLRPSPT